MKLGVLVHPSEMGIFVGDAMSMAFWSKLDAVGQTTVPLLTQQDAEQYVEHLVHFSDGHHTADEFEFVEIDADPKALAATIEMLKEVGLEEHLGDLLINAGAEYDAPRMTQ